MIYAKPTDYTCTTREEYDNLYRIWESVMAGEREMQDDEFVALSDALTIYEDNQA